MKTVAPSHAAAPAIRKVNATIPPAAAVSAGPAGGGGRTVIRSAYRSPPPDAAPGRPYTAPVTATATDPPFVPFGGAPDEPNDLAFAAVLLTCARRLAAAAVLWAACGAVVWLWWPQWRADFSRTEPWLAALSWWGEAAGVAWATGAILAGRLTWNGARRADGRPDGLRRWAVLGVLASLGLDFALTMGGFAADHAAADRTVPSLGALRSAERVPAARGGGVDVRLHVRFSVLPDPADPRQGRTHEGVTTVRVPPPNRWDVLDPAVGPDRLPGLAAAWAWAEAVGGVGPPLAFVAVRYDPTYPDRFWIAGQTWDRGAPSRFLLAMLPLLQGVILLAHLGWLPVLSAGGGGWLPAILVRHLPLFPLVSELLFLGLWGLMDAGWLP